jgi:hypothetical protein
MKRGEIFKSLTEDQQNHICYLYGRWLDEHEYEDWKDYENELKKIFPTMTKSSKRPFGVFVPCDEGLIHFYLKQDKGSLTFFSKIAV